MAAAAGESKPRRVVPGFGDISHEEVGSKPYDFEKDVSDALGTWYWAGPGILDLSGKFIGDAGAYRFARMIEERPKNLKCIDITSTGLNESGAVTVLSSLAKCPNLVSVTISNNLLGEKGGEALVKVVKQCPGLHCISMNFGLLYMEANDIDDNGAKRIHELCTELEESAERFSRWISYSGTRMSAEGVIANHDSGWTLTGIPLGNDGVAKVLRDSDILLAEYSTIDMQGVGLTDVSALADALKDNDKIEGLDLSGNTIGDKGAVALEEALSKNGTLFHLRVKNCGIGDEGKAALEKVRLDEGSALKWVHW